METNLSWSDLHDAVLEQLRVNWADGRIEATFLVNEYYVKSIRTATLLGTGLRNLACPRMNPWGQSTYVNEVREVDSKYSGLKGLEIELQSGDVIRVEGDSFVLSAAAD